MTPALGDDEHRRWSAIAVALSSSGVTFVLTGLYVALGLWGAAISVVLMNVVTLPMTWALWRRRIGLGTHTHVFAGALTASVLGTALTEQRVDLAHLTVLALVPSFVVLTLGLTAARAWLVVEFVAAIGLGLIYMLHLELPGMPEPPPLMSLGRMLASMSAMAGWTLLFERSRVRALNAERQANVAKTRFLANMSHELRTPMHGVLGLTEALLHSPLSSEQREHLRLIQTSGHSLVALLNDLLDHSKVEAGKLVIEKAEFDIRQLFDDVLRLHASQAATRKLTLSLDFEEAIPLLVRGDSLRMRQVLTNLVSNALKFTEVGGVQVIASIDDVTMETIRLRVDVKDTGIGIDPQVQSRLFVPFQQADESTSRRFGGTGLGLSLSNELAQMMGGRIQVTSKLGEGATFRFTAVLQKCRESAAQVVIAQPLARAEPISADPVLVVDDNPINLKVASSLVERAGYKALVASSGAEALELISQRRVMAVLMDVHMPAMDGFEATKRIRKLGCAWASVPIVALSAAAMPEEIAACRRAGMDGYLPKPTSLNALAYVLERIRRGQAIDGPAAVA
ncbi:MAG: response regulator [Archangium sp.]|nr:response regulator [Archangium sp.]